MAKESGMRQWVWCDECGEWLPLPPPPEEEERGGKRLGRCGGELVPAPIQRLDLGHWRVKIPIIGVDKDSLVTVAPREMGLDKQRVRYSGAPWLRNAPESVERCRQESSQYVLDNVFRKVDTVGHCELERYPEKWRRVLSGTSTHRSQVGTFTPQISTSFSRRDALGEIKDEAEDKFDEDTWFSIDEKRNKMTKESIVELLEEIPLPPPFSARVPALQEPANYGTDLETSVYEGQIRSGYRVTMHPFVVAFFNHYKMVPGQLVPNEWRKLVGLIYLVQTSGYLVTVDDFMRLYLEGGPKSNKGWHSRYFFIHWPSGKWEFPRKWNGFCKDYEKKGSLAPNATTKKLIDHIKMRGVLSINEPLSDQEMRHAGLIPLALAVPIPPTPFVESQLVLGPKTQGLAIRTSSSRTPSLEIAGKGVGAKGDFLGLLQKASKGKRKEGTGEGSSPLVKRAHAPTPPVPPLVVEDLPVEKDPIFCPIWTIKRGDSGMPSSHVSAQHLAHGVLPSDKLILENQPHEAFAMAHIQAAYNAYCYSSQMQDRFAMAMDVARTAKTDKRAAEDKADKLDKEVKNLKAENAKLLTKLGRLEKRCEKLRHEKVEVGNKAIQAFLDGTAGEEWLWKRTEDGLSIFQEGFQKAKELTMAKYPSLFLDDIVVPTFESPSGRRPHLLKLEMLFLLGMLPHLRTIYIDGVDYCMEEAAPPQRATANLAVAASGKIKA
ncbi:hypothetical protein RJ639_019976 [Escallonia herrerae]|uniref:Transposase (Putative), gypsy type n=1 Tax=Escallonia herrerae TaxID=1293975 RepID=A0AA89AHV0_9ASTE|nr:hypothetical protein RJ639_019976 [Escallonia herrerae]